MPYKMFKQDGKFCVRNSDTGESKGCSDSEDMAKAHMRALYANEKKELEEKELDALVESSIEIFEECADCGEKEVTPAPRKIKNLTEKITDFVKGLLNLDAESVEPENKEKVFDTGLMVWKSSSGDFRWIARYSNNFRDNDNPPEIISKESHLRFIERVEKGLAPYPELWIWHRPEWKIGQADFLTHDEVNGAVFTIASGTIDADKKEAAEWLANVKETILVSHGMPVTSIKRDESDPSVITEYETREVSPLPDWAAANKLTGFVLTKEDEMAIPAEKREKLIQQWGASPELLDRLEALNARDASAAKEAGVESKEAGAETPAETKDADATEASSTSAENTTTTENTAGDASVPVEKISESSPDYPTRQEVAEAVAAVLQPFMDKVEALSSSLEGVHKEVSDVTAAVAEIAKSEGERLAAIVKETPSASLAAMIASRAIGSPETQVKKTETLAKSKPKEAETVDHAITGINFIDKMLTAKSDASE